jgi:ketosteroid isomerase-like protein
MKNQLIYLIIILLALGLNGCATAATQALPTSQPPTSQPPTSPPPTSLPPTQTSAPQAPPSDMSNEAVVLDMVARLNAGDVDGSLAYFAEDAVSYFIGMPPTGMEFYRGREALRPMWEYCVGDNFEWEVDIASANGDIVVAKTKTWMDFTRDLGVAPNDFFDVFKVEDGKITVYGSTMIEEALAEFKPALAEVMPPAPTPDTSAETPGAELSFTFADGTCSYEGPAVLKAGDIKVNWEVKDQDREKYALTIFTLDKGKDLVDLMASTSGGGPPSWSDMFFYQELGPGENQSYEGIILEDGPVYVVCWSKPPDLPIGNYGPLEVRK